MTVTKIKICGLTNSIDAEAAIAAGATDLGFVMGGSVLPQEIEPRAQHVRNIVRSVGTRARVHLVTHLTTAEDIADLAEYLGCYGIQVSEPIAVGELQALRSYTDRPIIKTIATYADDFLEALRRYEPYCDEVLVDSSLAGYTGGTGVLNNLERCSQVVRTAIRPVWLAGGLTPDNVAEAMAVSGAVYADVSTGVSCYGPQFPRKDRKDPEKMREFVAQVRGL
jgi:phosphoribosylanthranilate isomerase